MYITYNDAMYTLLHFLLQFSSTATTRANTSEKRASVTLSLALSSPINPLTSGAIARDPIVCREDTHSWTENTDAS